MGRPWQGLEESPDLSLNSGPPRSSRSLKGYRPLCTHSHLIPPLLLGGLVHLPPVQGHGEVVLSTSSSPVFWVEFYKDRAQYPGQVTSGAGLGITTGGNPTMNSAPQMRQRGICIDLQPGREHNDTWRAQDELVDR